jgi:hypothetical protein
LLDDAVGALKHLLQLQLQRLLHRLLRLHHNNQENLVGAVCWVAWLLV